MPDKTTILFFSHRIVKIGCNNTSQIFAHYFINGDDEDAFLLFVKGIKKIKKSLSDNMDTTTTGEEVQEDRLLKLSNMIQAEMLKSKMVDIVQCKPVLTYLNGQPTDTEINFTQAFQLRLDTGLMMPQSSLETAAISNYCHYFNTIMYNQMHIYNKKEKYDECDNKEDQLINDLTSSPADDDTTAVTTTPSSTTVHNNNAKKKRPSSIDDMSSSSDCIAKNRSKRHASAMRLSSKSKEAFVIEPKKQKKIISKTPPAPAAKKTSPIIIRSNSDKRTTKKINHVIKTPSGK